jgi:hypothetical protein
VERQKVAVVALGIASLACAPAGRMGEEIHIAEESAIIIWDAASKTQHFIRRAAFETKAKDFGFLVPTPSVPKLEEADDDVFDELARITRPPEDPRAETPKGEMKMAVKAAAPTAAAVKVLATAKVAGLDAAVLEANDAKALNEWLARNGYSSGPDLLEWFKPYIERNWKITAFKIDQEATRGRDKAVRMSFQTDRPFFPYREPASQRKQDSGKSRLLRVYVLGDARFEGRIGAADAWPGETLWSAAIGDYERGRILELSKLGKDVAAGAKWLTRFQDVSSPRPGTDDVFFSKAADQAVVKAPANRYADSPHGSFYPGGSHPGNRIPVRFRFGADSSDLGWYSYDLFSLIGYTLGLFFLTLLLLLFYGALRLLWWIGSKAIGR